MEPRSGLSTGDGQQAPWPLNKHLNPSSGKPQRAERSPQRASRGCCASWWVTELCILEYGWDLPSKTRMC